MAAAAAVGGGGEARSDALLGAGKSLIGLGNRDAGLNDLRAARDAAPVGSGARARADYLLLRELNQGEKWSEAVSLFRSAGGEMGSSPVQGYFTLEGARALAGSGDASAAEAAWAAITSSTGPDAALRTAARQARVEAARDSGDDSWLGAALDDLLADAPTSRLRYERAQLAKRQGDNATFARQLGAIVANDPSSSFALLALDALDDAGVAMDPGQAGLVYYRRGQYADAKAVLAPAIEAAPTADDLAFRAFYLGAAYEDSGQADDAVHFYDVAANSGGSAFYVHRAKYWAARVTESAGRAGEASQRYVALVRNGPSGEFSEESAFRAGYVLYTGRDVPGALAAWDSVAGADSARLEYWKGRALALAGDAAGSRLAYQRAVALGPYEFHGLEAARELGSRVPLDVGYEARDLSRPISWQAIESWLTGVVGPAPAPGTATSACELTRVGLRSQASTELRTAANGAGAWRTYEVMREAKSCGVTDVAAELAVVLRSKAGVASYEVPRDLLRISYPIDFAPALNAAAKDAGVDPLFFASLIRQESFWDPAAGSVAGALGLTQMIPQTGQAVASSLGVAGFEADDLFLASVSLRFGGYYLGGELKTYGDPLLALAAYNAGPSAAGRWRAAQAKSPADLLEVIDYAETNAYVTLIYEAYAHYQLAWG
jgi:soluble lytic murein transglycosylase